jgi:hypothetical protein
MDESRHGALVEEAAAPGKPTLEAKMMYLDRAQVYTDEPARRENVRQGQRMERLTRSIYRLTWVITGATIIGVVLTAISLLS